MIFKNYYKILGLENNIKSTQEEIKSAYRTQAKKYHPDVNVNNKNAEERFKDINEAYKVLSDFTQKRKYDRSWYYYVGKKIQKEKMSKREVKVNDIVNMFFGGGVSNDVKKEKKIEPIKGENIEAQIEIQIKEAFEGTHKKLSFNVLDSKNKIINIDIPAGVKNGEVIRIPKQGKEGKNGGENGDVLVKIKIADNNIYKLVNSDIWVNLYVTPWDAALGAKLAVNGIDGELSILIPKGTQNGDKIAIPNKGYYINNKERGKLIIKTEIVIPKKLNDKEKELLTKLKKVSKFNPNNLVDIK